MAISPSRVWRGLLVWLHVVASVCWMGQGLALLVLLGLSAAAPGGELKVATADVADLLDRTILGTSAITAAFTGFGLAALTSWGYFRSWWVSTKFVLTIAQVLTGTLVVAQSFPHIKAAARAGEQGPVVACAVAVGLIAVGAAFQVWLSVAKPWGRTPRGRRAQAQGVQGQLPTAPVRLVASMFAAVVLDVVMGVVVFHAPLPILSSVVLALTLVLRHLARSRVLAGTETGTATRVGTGRRTGIGGASGASPAKAAPTSAVTAGVVVERALVVPEVAMLRLAPADGSPVALWEPGAHIDLRLASGKVRQYSLHGDPADRRGYQVSVLREPGGRGGSAEIFDLQQGSLVGIGGPRNNFPLVEASSYLFVAGGIGITALKPMIERVHAAGSAWRLVYRGRTRAAMPFAEELAERYPGRVQILPADTTPRPDLTVLVSDLPPGSAVYCCGPANLMDALAETMLASCPQASLHVERFAGTVKDDTRNQPFQVVLPHVGSIVSIPVDQTVLESLREVLPDTPASCETGVCGSCEMRVLAGRPEHRDDILTGADRDRTDIIYPCVSRSRDALLVLDA